MVLKKNLFFLFAFISFQAFSDEKTILKDTFSIDFRLNTKNDDKKNYLNWTTSSQKIRDHYDAVSGASVSHSAGGLFSVIHGTNQKKLLAPKGLRSLLLFPVSSPDFLKSDNLEISQDKEGKTIIRFTHRKIKYLIRTDDKGKIDIEKDFFIAQNQDENITNKNKSEKEQFIEQNDENSIQNDGKTKKEDEKASDKLNTDIHEEDEKAAKKTEISEEKIPPELAAEGFDFDKPTGNQKYMGKLKASLKNGILKINGKLKLVEISESNAE